ncbi:chemosensory receptor A [Elysia marginata]|uniref:Chemosensory receptor A n=1 Tax=Elysia marginata TaxID=1093978 RepID=A0AAV4JI72_9GAST|nr:chemosensory receptor A [Elysia marginata]
MSTENPAAIALKTRTTTPFFIEFMDEHKRKIAEIVMDYVVIFSISILGVVTNSLVILVYSKQGFRESVAVSMTTISIWDLIKCIAGVLNNFSGILSIFDPIASHSWLNISTVVFNYIICFSSYVTSVMAAYVAVERCLCVTIPLKVKWLLTPRITLIACLTMSAVVFGAFAVMFGIYDIVWVWSDTFNATVATYRKNKFYIQNDAPLFAYYNISGIIWPLGAFVVILVATIIIIVKLRQGSKFRLGQSGTTSSQPEGSSSQDQQKQQQQHLLRRDRQVVKMLLVIIIIYIACLAPRIAHYLAKYIVYDFYFLRRHHHLFEFVNYGIMVADSTNGAVNFFVFYSMSSSFRSTFRAMFCISQSPKPSLNISMTTIATRD